MSPRTRPATSSTNPARAAQPDDSADPALVEEIRRGMLDKLFGMQAKFPEVATAHDWYSALAYVVRDRILYQWIDTAHTYYQHDSRTVIYLSAEYLLGPQLGCNLLNLGLRSAASEAARSL